MTCARDRGFKSLWRWSMEVAFRNPAGCSAQILWSSSLDTKARRSDTPIFDWRTSRDKHQDRSHKAFNLDQGDGRLVEYARESARSRLGREMVTIARN